MMREPVMGLTCYDAVPLAGRDSLPTPDPGAARRTDPGAALEASRDLRRFVRLAWHVVEPATPFIEGWHIDAVCEHLMAVSRGDIRNLLINIPPRHMKSLAVGVF